MRDGFTNFCVGLTVFIIVVLSSYFVGWIGSAFLSVVFMIDISAGTVGMIYASFIVAMCVVLSK